MFGKVPLLGLIPAIIGGCAIKLPGTVFLPALIALRMGGGGMIENVGRGVLEAVNAKALWFWLTTKETKKKEVEKLVWGES